jgi:hypothetical protein
MIPYHSKPQQKRNPAQNHAVSWRNPYLKIEIDPPLIDPQSEINWEPPDSKIVRPCSKANYRPHPHKPNATLRQKHLPQSVHFRTPNELFRGSSNKDNYNKHSSNYTKEISPLLKTYKENHHIIGVSKNPELS